MTAKIGDNSAPAEQLKDIVERIEKLVEERSCVNETIKAVLDGAEGAGFDKKTIREMLKIRKLDKEEREEKEMLRDLYLSHLGLL